MNLGVGDTNIPPTAAMRLSSHVTGNYATLSEPGLFYGDLGDAHIPAWLPSNGRAKPLLRTLKDVVVLILSLCPLKMCLKGVGMARSLPV